jgi:hypothetical protein
VWWYCDTHHACPAAVCAVRADTTFIGAAEADVRLSPGDGTHCEVMVRKGFKDVSGGVHTAVYRCADAIGAGVVALCRELSANCAPPDVLQAGQAAAAQNAGSTSIASDQTQPVAHPVCVHAVCSWPHTPPCVCAGGGSAPRPGVRGLWPGGPLPQAGHAGGGAVRAAYHVSGARGADDTACKDAHRD